MTVISQLLLASLLPHLTCTARVNVGIVNGQEAKPHSRPYMVSIQYDKEHVCGGFLISDEFVLTAAHCREESEILTVVVGAHDLKYENKGSVRIGVKSYHKHPDFTEIPLMNDIMLLRLEKKIEENKKVHNIFIPKHREDIKADSVCSVAGWGSLRTNGSASDRLMEANVEIMHNTECKKRWGRIYSAPKMMCTYGFGGFCDGDSGGPLVCGDTAVGVVSFYDTDLCNSPEYPNVYTKISSYLQWIRKIIKKFQVNSWEGDFS